jgi:hypothetical protein
MYAEGSADHGVREWFVDQDHSVGGFFRGCFRRLRVNPRSTARSNIIQTTPVNSNACVLQKLVAPEAI